MKKILIVEDVELNTELLVQLLEDNYELLIATDGAAGVNMTEQDKPDLVLMEAALPGNEVCAAVCEIRAKWAGTRTVVLVENARQQQEAEAAGADVVLYQGVRAARFIDVIEELLFANLDTESGEV